MAKLQTSDSRQKYVDVLDTIRQHILANDLVPGQRLVEEDICAMLGCSHGAVRSALIHLTHEGLVERIVNRGARVRVVGLQEALHIAEVQTMIESLCVTRTVKRITNKQIQELQRLAKQLNDDAIEGNMTSFANITHQIVERYIRIADQPVAGAMLARLQALSSTSEFRLIYRPGRTKAAAPLWIALVDAICSRDCVAARRALRRHSKGVREAMKAMAKEHTPFELISTTAGVETDSKN